MTSLRILSSSVVTSLAHPRVWLTAWLVVTIAAVTCVYPVFTQLDDALGRQPGAGLLFDQALDADFARLHPEAVVSLGGASLVVERMVRMPCAGQFSDLHKIHHGVADWRAVGRALEQHNFTVVRNRATYAPDGTADETTADRALVAAADVRARRLGVDFRRPVPPPHDRPPGRWALLIPWFRREP